MEEEPVMVAPDLERLQQQEDFIEINEESIANTSQPTTAEPLSDEFSLDDIITAPREKTREEIIAEAEEAAFAQI